MSEPAFFSFHYERDVHRAWNVRNSGVTKFDDENSFDDRGLREAVRKNDERAIRAAINRGIRETSATVVLIGAETASRPWVQYEIERTFIKGNALLGVYIHGMKCLRTKVTDRKGANPFRFTNVEVEEGIIWTEVRTINLWQEYGNDIPIYDWVEDDGRNNLADWIDDAVYNCPWE